MISAICVVEPAALHGENWMSVDIAGSFSQVALPAGKGNLALTMKKATNLANIGIDLRYVTRYGSE